MPVPHLMRVILAGLCAGVLLPSVVSAQEATLHGAVTEETHAVLPGVTVTATDLDTGRERTAVSDARGEYRLSLPAGRYQIKAELAGFGTTEVPSLELLVAQNRTLPMIMRVASRKEEVVVTADAPLIDTQTSEVSGNIDRRQMEQLPISGRNWMELSMLVKGITANDVGNNRPGVQRDDQFSLSLDGQNITQGMVDSGPIGQPGISREAVAEFKIVTNMFDVTLGRSTGLQVQAISRSGTNHVHGSVYGFFRDNSLNAKDLVADRVLPYSNQQIGGSLGGPIKRDRTHFFASYEFEREPDTFVLTPPVYGGQTISFPTQTEKHNALGRLDHQIDSNNQLTFRAMLWDQRNPFGNLTASSYPTDATSQVFNSRSIVGTWTRQISSSTAQQIRLGYFRYHWQFRPADGVPLTEGYNFPGQVVGARFNHPQEFWQNAVSARYDLTAVRSRHTWKVGGEYIHEKDTGLWFQQARGTFFFSARPADFVRRFPLEAWNDASRWDLSGLDPQVIRFDQFFGDFSVDLPRPILGLWIADTWRASDRLTANFGVRYDNDRGITAPPHVVASDIFTPGIHDNDNIAPRAGFSYDVTGKSTFVIRGGSGLFYGNPMSEVGFDAQLFNGQRVLSNSFPNDRQPGFIEDPTRGVTAEDIINGEVPLPAQQPFAVSPDYEMPYTWQSSFGFQKQLGSAMSVEADLVYARGYDQGRGYDPNLFFDEATGYNKNPTTAGRPNPSYTTIILRTSDGKSNSLALATGFTRRYRDNFQGGVTYTHMFYRNDDGGGNNAYGGSPDNMFCYLECEWARSVDYQKHTLRVNALYQARWGIVLAGTYYYGSGNYFQTTYSANPFALARNTNRYNNGAPVTIPENVRDRFDGPDVIATGTVVPRNAFHGLPLHKVDLRVSKDVSFGKDVRVTGIAEVFNLFNHDNFGAYSTQVNTSTFGQPVQSLANTYLSRRFQLGAKLAF